MIASKHARQLALVVLLGGSALLPALAGGFAARIDESVVHASGKGTIHLPSFTQEGLMAAVMLGEGGERYGLDAVLTTWIPSEPVPELMFGGLYGRVIEVDDPAPAAKARVEGSWKMLDERSGFLRAQIVRDVDGAAQVVGRVEGKFLVERAGEGAEFGNSDGHLAPLSGAVGLEMLLAQ